MKTITAIVSIFVAFIFGNANGILPVPPISVDPNPNPGDIVICTLDMKICAEGQYSGTGLSGCQDCLQCPQTIFEECANGETPIKNAHIENECPTWRCPDTMCTLDLKICAEEQFLGTGKGGCPECLSCPLKKIGCPGGVSPIKNPRQENKCTTWRCPAPKPACTKEMKICKLGQYLGTGASGCPECLQCPQPRIGCPGGVWPRQNPAQQNKCPTWYCPRPLPNITPAVE